MKIDPPILVKAAKKYGFELSELKPLGGMEGMALASRRKDGNFVLKITPKKSGITGVQDEIIAKSEFINYLADNGVRVAKPVRSPLGNWVEVIRTKEMNYIITAATRVKGKHLDLSNPRQTNPEHFETWGKITGQMHKLAKSYPHWKRYNEHGELISPISDWKGEYKTFSNWCQFDSIREKWISLNQKIERFPINRSSYGLIHNDLHPRNFVIDKSGLISVIDFDVSSFHFYIKDIAIPLFFINWIGEPVKGQSKDTYLTNFMQNFIKGYESENNLDDFWYKELPIFLKHHRILLYIVFCDEWKIRNPWQSNTLQKWRKQILADAPVLKILI